MSTTDEMQTDAEERRRAAQAQQRRSPGTEEVAVPEEDENARSADPDLDKSEKDLGFFERNPRAKFLIFSVILVALVLGVLFWLHSRRWVDTDDAQVDGHIYDVNARVGGQVLKVNGDDGQFVHAGDVLVVIDPKDYQVALQKAQADFDDAVATAHAAALNVPITTIGSTTQISSADADVLNTQAGLAAAQEQADAAQAQLAEAQSSAKKANTDVERYRTLLDKNEIAAAAIRPGGGNRGLGECDSQRPRCLGASGRRTSAAGGVKRGARKRIWRMRRLRRSRSG